MNKNIAALIAEGEGLRTEFKSKIDNPAKIAKTIASLANTSGGTLLIGVSDNKGITGIGSELAELQKLEKAIKMIEPQLVVHIRSEMLEEKKILVVSVDESLEKPHYVVSDRGARLIFIRVKDKSVPIPKLLLFQENSEEIGKLLASRHVKSLISFLKMNDSINAKGFAKLINISEKRADRMLHELAAKQILLKVSSKKPELFSLKWSE